MCTEGKRNGGRSLAAGRRWTREKKVSFLLLLVSCLVPPLPHPTRTPSFWLLDIDTCKLFYRRFRRDLNHDDEGLEEKAGVYARVRDFSYFFFFFFGT